MKIKNVEISNFKSIQCESIDFESLAIFVGSNGSGKSNFLKALEYFYDPKISVDSDDFFDRNISAPIEIRVTFNNLSEEEIEHFGKYVTSNKELIVIKRFVNMGGTGSYYGMSLGCKDFASLQRKPVDIFKEEYNTLREQTKYQDLAFASTGPTIEKALEKWEEENKGKLELVEAENQFFGFDNSSVHSLEKFTKFVYIPAVLYESHLEDSRNSPIGDLTDILARHKLKEDEDIKRLQEEISKKYAEKLKPFNEKEMSHLSVGITKILQNYYSDVGVKVQLDDTMAEVKLPSPKAEIKVKEGGYETQISLVGQGLQRAFILSLLQYFAENKASSDEAEQFNLILGIDEPELYQHPSKQKLFHKILKNLSCSGSSVASSIQCFYTTHSPLMITIEDFNHIIRVCKTTANSGATSETKVKRSSLEELAREEGKLPSRGAMFTELKTLSSMVNAIDSRVNEGFFSKVVVLVEGESDLVALKLAAKHYSKGAIDLDVMDIPIISCNGKNNLEKPAIIFLLLGITTYTIWDSDKELSIQAEALKKELDEALPQDKERIENKLKGKKDAVDGAIKKNKDLLALHALPESDWPILISEKCACLENNIETLLKEELGEAYLSGLVEKHNQEIQAKGAWKNPLVMTEVLNEAFSSGKRSETLERIIEAIIAIKEKEVT
jgi:predicted ATP-dependent endonuclease of OLD family